jgi:hypothetical protein
VSTRGSKEGGCTYEEDDVGLDYPLFTLLFRLALSATRDLERTEIHPFQFDLSHQNRGGGRRLTLDNLHHHPDSFLVYFPSVRPRHSFPAIWDSACPAGPDTRPYAVRADEQDNGHGQVYREALVFGIWVM